MILKFVFSIHFLLLISTQIIASEHGIYLQTNRNINSDIQTVTENIISSLEGNQFTILNSIEVHTPDYVREDTLEHCGFKAQLIILSSSDYLEFLTSYDSKYLIAGFLKVGIYETHDGIQVNI
ncbi:MAG: hypothetical protein R3250_16290, partial [Melioribacteraceae bacterium]|nr:hypothetical protein [Melioribacteraceae bacterium]